jgi:hypothetical protein
MDSQIWHTGQVKIHKNSSQGWKSYSMSSMKITHHTTLSQNVKHHLRLEVTLKLRSPKTSTTTSSPTTSSYWLRFSGQQLWKMFQSYCHTRTKRVLWWTNDNLLSMQSTSSAKRLINLLRIEMSPLSVRSKVNNPEVRPKTTQKSRK